MKLTSRVVAVGVVAALTLGTPAAASAAGPGSKAKGKTTAAQQQAKAKAAKAAAQARAEAARKKKQQEARSRFAFPGTVVSVSETGLKITRKERGVTVTREFVLDRAAVVKADGVRIALADVAPGDHVVAHGRRVGADLVVSKLNVERRAAPAPAPVETATPTATIVI